jgi:hypothetical protein
MRRNVSPSASESWPMPEQQRTAPHARTSARGHHGAVLLPSLATLLPSLATPLQGLAVLRTLCTPSGRGLASPRGNVPRTATLVPCRVTSLGAPQRTSQTPRRTSRAQRENVHLPCEEPRRHREVPRTQRGAFSRVSSGRAEEHAGGGELGEKRPGPARDATSTARNAKRTARNARSAARNLACHAHSPDRGWRTSRRANQASHGSDESAGAVRGASRWP